MLEKMGKMNSARNYYERAANAFIAGRGDQDDGATCMANYAIFLDEVLRDHGAAETWYRTAIKHDKLDGSPVANYGWFLHVVKHDHAMAERKFLDAIHRSPISATAHCFYAAFLHQTSRQRELAQWHFQRAKTLNPMDSCVNEMREYLDADARTNL